jgi:hypothetical protein
MKTEWIVITATASVLEKLLNNGWFCEKMTTNTPLVGELLITMVLSKSIKEQDENI